MKKVMLAVMVLSVSTVGFGALSTVVSDGFQDGDYTVEPVWTPSTAGNWQVIQEPGNPSNYVLDQTNTDSIDLNFSAYTYNGRNDPTGPEWQLSFKYSSGLYNGNNFSSTKVFVGDFGKGLWINDSNPYWGWAKCAWVDGGPVQGWGTGGDQTGVYWYQVTLAWEGSTDTLTGTITDIAAGTSQSNSWTTGGFNSISSISLGGTLDGGKQKYFDDVVFAAAPEPATIGLLLVGLGLIRKRAA